MTSNATLRRIEAREDYTLGVLEAPGFHCFTMERPWKNNEQNASCIPAGEYDCKVRVSPRFGRVYMLLSVPGRSYILIHAGNTANNTHGCILLGRKAGYIDSRRAVLLSHPTLRRFMQVFGGEVFKLTIKGKQHVA